CLFQSKVQPTKEDVALVAVDGSLDLDLVGGGDLAGCRKSGERESDTRGLGEEVLGSGGSNKRDGAFNEEVLGSGGSNKRDGAFNAGLRSNSQRRRSVSPPPFKTCGPGSLLGQGEDVGL
ncbi:hypothetical protein A2U01_0061493, partial [Trifolium medium]|nr:hypothetical protein [Trifolium medium]